MRSLPANSGPFLPPSPPLPTEILLVIFSLATRGSSPLLAQQQRRNFSLVSRAWYHTLQPVLQSTVPIGSIDQARRLCYGPWTRALCLQDLSIVLVGAQMGVERERREAVDPLLSSCRSLKRLHLELPGIFGDGGTSVFSMSRPCLERFSFSAKTTWSDYESNGTLISLLYALPSLKILHVQHPLAHSESLTSSSESRSAYLPTIDKPFPHHLTSLGFDISPPLYILQHLLSHSISSLKHLELGCLPDPASGDRLCLLAALKPIVLKGQLVYFGVNDKSVWDPPYLANTWLDSLLPLLKSVRTLQLGPRGYSSSVFRPMGALESLEQVSIVWSPTVWGDGDLAQLFPKSARGQRRLQGVEIYGDFEKAETKMIPVMGHMASREGVRFTYTRAGYAFGLA